MKHGVQASRAAIATCLALWATVAFSVEDSYMIGTGIHDITGPVAQIGFMGYAKTSQVGHGVHTRLRSRAFIVSQTADQYHSVAGAREQHADHAQSQQDQLVAEGITVGTIRRSPLSRNTSHASMSVSTSQAESLRGRRSETAGKSSSQKGYGQSSAHPQHRPSPDRTVCFVSVDIGMGSDLLTLRVLRRLEQLLPPSDQQKRRLCHVDNLSISGTHTHSAPGGFIQYTLYQITTAGFSSEVMDVYVEGIAQSILKAYRDLRPGTVTMNKAKLFGANINRSPSSYLLNPEAERKQYEDDNDNDSGDTDKTMLQVYLDHYVEPRENQHSDSLRPAGLINWFPVHGTSMNSSNLLVSGDNKGYASYLMEKYMVPHSLPGKGNVIAAFASTNLGDVSPNTDGAKCIDTGEPCDLVTSTCNGSTNLCIAAGPGKDMKDSAEIIGRRQFDKSVELLNSVPRKSLTGPIGFRHSFVDMSNVTVILPNGTKASTCTAALGYAFAGGTTDGPGTFPFHQATNSSNPFWNMVGGFLSVPTAEQIACQAPKPILLNTGNVKLPYAWDPESVPISIFRIGSLFILNVPSEFTTMAGRRLRKAVGLILEDHGIDDAEITIAGLANSYTHYVTTFEEYAGQRYEAASTLYGPHTLDAYIQQFRRITLDLMNDRPSASNGAPKDLGEHQVSLILPSTLDTIGFAKKFGSVAIEPKDSYVIGNDTVAVSFRSANPRNNPRIEDTFLTVEMLTDEGRWETKYVDGDWCTQFYWKGGSMGSYGVSFAEISWDIPADIEQGIYRICHFGTRKTFIGNVEWMLMHAPGWWLLDAFGSMAVGIVLEVIRIVDHYCRPLSEFLRSISFARNRDFDGCTRSFLVRHSGAVAGE